MKQKNSIVQSTELFLSFRISYSFKKLDDFLFIINGTTLCKVDGVLEYFAAPLLPLFICVSNNQGKFGKEVPF